MPPRQQTRNEGGSKPLIPLPSLPANPMTYQANRIPVSATPHPPSYSQPQIPQGLPMMQTYMQPAPMMYAPTGIPIPGYLPPQGHYNPAMAFRQAIFQQPVYGIPTQTPEGYSYSATYLQQQQQQQQQFQPGPQPIATTSKLPTPSSNTESSRPAKRARPNPPSGNDPAPSTDIKSKINVAPTVGGPIPTRTKLPLRKGQSEASQGFWRNCTSPGCAYVGPDKEVIVHEQDRHLIFKDSNKVKVSEEEEEAARRVGGPRPAIPGTSIVLETDEDIARWIAERKARWPTSSRVAQKEKERQEKIDRGELDPNEGRGNSRDRGRGRGRGRERGRGGSRGGGFAERGQTRGRRRGQRGRDSGYGGRAGIKEGDDQEEVQDDDDDSEEESSEDGSTDSDQDEEDQEALQKGDTVDTGNDDEDEEDDDDDAPPETHDVRTRVAAIDTTKTSLQTNEADSSMASAGRRAVCRSFARTGRCKFGNKCRYEHTASGKEREPAIDTSVESAPINPFARPSLLGAMLERPMQQTLLTLTEAIDFIVDNDFFDGVELVPGQAEEMERTLNQITEVESATTSVVAGAQPGNVQDESG